MLCPKFEVILAYIVEDRFGFSVKSVSRTTNMVDWVKRTVPR